MQTILVVEDNLSLREAIQDLLEDLDYRVLLASDGREALAVYHQADGEVDLVLSDMMMPEIDGRDLFRRLAQEKPDIKMIIMTGFPLKDSGQALLEEGIVAWIEKPFKPDEIADQVAQALRLDAGAAQARQRLPAYF